MSIYSADFYFIEVKKSAGSKACTFWTWCGCKFRSFDVQYTTNSETITSAASRRVLMSGSSSTLSEICSSACSVLSILSRPRSWVWDARFGKILTRRQLTDTWLALIVFLHVAYYWKQMSEWRFSLILKNLSRLSFPQFLNLWPRPFKQYTVGLR